MLKFRFDWRIRNVRFIGGGLNNLTSVIHYSLGVSPNYSLFFSSSSWLFIIHSRFRVLFYSLFH